MELDDLKVLLKEKLEANAVNHSAHELESAVRHKTISVMGKIKRSIAMELVLGLACMIAFVFLWFRHPTLSVTGFLLGATCTCVGFIFYLILLYKRIHRFERSLWPLKENLTEAIHILEKFAQLYFRLSIIMLPVAFVTGLLLGLADVSQQGLSLNFNWGKAITIYLFCFLVWSVIMYFFAKWYIHKLYGKHLLQLKIQLQDLENG